MPGSELVDGRIGESAADCVGTFLGVSVGTNR